MIDRKDVTIIIPHLGENKDQKYSLTQCLTSLKETEPDIRVLIAKNGGMEMLEGIANEYPAIYLKTQGQCLAVNTAVKSTRTSWIMISNDDMVYAPGWWDNLAFSIPSQCVSPKLVEPRPGAPTFQVYFCGGAGGDFDKQKWLDFAKEYKGEGLRTGFNLPFLITRELWDTVGGYDINYDPWGSNSDSDLEYKIRLAGVQPYQNTNSIVYHFSNTSGTFESRNNEYWHKNFRYFKDKWGFERTDDRIWEADFDLPAPPIRTFAPEWEGIYA